MSYQYCGYRFYFCGKTFVTNLNILVAWLKLFWKNYNNNICITFSFLNQQYFILYCYNVVDGHSTDFKILNKIAYLFITFTIFRSILIKSLYIFYFIYLQINHLVLSVFFLKLYYTIHDYALMVLRCCKTYSLLFYKMFIKFPLVA